MAHAKKTTAHVGLVPIPVRLEVAVDSESSDIKVVCTGEGTHEPSRVNGSMTCPVCETKHSSHWGFKDRGVEEAGGIVLLTPEQLADAKGEPVKELHLSFHYREDVYGNTVAGDSVQNMTPDKGGEKAYNAFMAALLEHPDVVAVAVYAPSTKNAFWVLEPVGGRLVLSKRAWPEDVRQAPTIPVVEVPVHEQAMMNMVIETSIRDFVLTDYLDAARHGTKALIASRLGTAVAAANGSPVGAPSGDMMAALQATLDANQQLAKPKVVRSTARKTAAKKAPAKRTAAKRTTARKTAAKPAVKKSA